MAVNRIPNNLKKYRHIAGYSQKKVAAILGVSYTGSICKWEKGLLYPGIFQLFTLAKLYNTVPHELYTDMWQNLKQGNNDVGLNKAPGNEYFHL